MKKKKLAKIIKKAVFEGQSEYNKPSKGMVVEGRRNDELFSESSDDSKIKIRKLITQLSNHRDELDFVCNDNVITIHTPYDERKRPSGTISKSKNTFDIEIIKEVGFIVNINDHNRRILMKDATLYDEMKEKIKEISNQINQNNFTDLYNVIMKDNGLNRQSNLDDLLGQL